MQKNLKGLSLKAIAIGFLTDIGSTLVFGFAFGLLATMLLMSSGQGVEELRNFTTTTVFRVVMPLVGLLFTGLGGYVAARIAKQAEMENAFAMGIASALFGILSLVLSPVTSSLWIEGLAIFLTVVCALAGGYVRMKTKGGDSLPGA